MKREMETGFLKCLQLRNSEQLCLKIHVTTGNPVTRSSCNSENVTIQSKRAILLSVSHLEILVCLDEVQRLVQNGPHGAQPIAEVDHVSLPQHVTGDPGEATVINRQALNNLCDGYHHQPIIN